MKSSQEMSSKLSLSSSFSIEDIIKSLSIDPSIRSKMKSLGIDETVLKKNIPLFLTYQESEKCCKNCKGMENCSLSPLYHTMDLFIDDSGVLNRRFGYCRYLMEKESIKNGYLYRDFPSDMLSLNIKTLPNKKDAMDFLLLCSDALLERKIKIPWVYLEGESGVGKSTLAVASMNGFIKSGNRVAYLDCVKRFDELKNLAIKDKALFSSSLKALEEVDMLVLDSFGNEFKSNYLRDQLLMPLLNARSKKNFFTLFVSEFSYQEIEAMHSYSRDASILAKRLSSLLEKKCGKPFILQGGAQTYL